MFTHADQAWYQSVIHTGHRCEFSKYSHQKSGTELALKHCMVLWDLEYPMSESNTILCKCSGTSAKALNENTALTEVVACPTVT